MKTLLYLIAALCTLGIESALAQGDSGGCDLCACVADNTCYSSLSSCASTSLTDCRSTTFRAPCTQNYTIRAAMACSAGELCKECYACVRIYNGTTEVGVCHNTCEAFDCTEECTVALVGGTTYTLYVCLRKCFDGECANCDCTARGYVYETWGDCDTGVACNP